MVVNHDAVYIKEETILSTISVLNNHGIGISKECIPKKRIQKNILSYENLAYANEKAAERFLGEEFETESDGDTLRYIQGEKSLTISGSEVLYENSRQIVAVESFEQTKKFLISDLKSVGYNENDISFENVKTENGICYATVCLLFDGKRVNGAEMNMEADAQGILKLGGRCFSLVNTKKTNEKMTDVTSALCSMIYNPDYFGIDIEKIEVAYYIDSEYIDGSDVAAYPVYAVTDGGGYRHILKDY